MLIGNSSSFLEFFERVTAKAQAEKQGKGEQPLPRSLLYIFFDNWLVKIEQMIKHSPQDASPYLRDEVVLLRRESVIGLLLFSTLPANAIKTHLPKIIGLSSVLITDVTRYKKDQAFLVTFDRKDLVAAQRKKVKFTPSPLLPHISMPKMVTILFFLIQIEQSDPVASTNLLQLFATKLKELASAYPNEVTTEWISQVVDPPVLSALQEL